MDSKAMRCGVVHTPASVGKIHRNVPSRCIHKAQDFSGSGTVCPTDIQAQKREVEFRELEEVNVMDKEVY